MVTRTGGQIYDVTPTGARRESTGYCPTKLVRKDRRNSARGARVAHSRLGESANRADLVSIVPPAEPGRTTNRRGKNAHTLRTCREHQEMRYFWKSVHRERYEGQWRVRVFWAQDLVLGIVQSSYFAPLWVPVPMKALLGLSATLIARLDYHQ